MTATPKQTLQTTAQQTSKRKAPVESLHKCFTRAMHSIECADGQVALYFVGGRLVGTHERSGNLAAKLRQFASSLLGVYEADVDTRFIYADLQDYFSQFDPPPAGAASAANTTSHATSHTKPHTTSHTTSHITGAYA